MTRFILRTVLTAAAVVLMFAGSFNLNRTRAGAELGEDADVIATPVASRCQDLAGCPGGSITCGTLILPDGTIVKCGMPQ